MLREAELRFADFIVIMFPKILPRSILKPLTQGFGPESH